MPKHKVIVGERVLRNFEFLNRLARTKSKLKIQEMLNNAGHDELLAIVEVCRHILSSEFLLSSRQKQRLVPYAEFVRKLRRVRSEKGAKQVIQEGSGLIHTHRNNQTGGLGFLPSLLIPVLIEAASSLLSK